MTPDDIQEMREQIAALNDGIEMVMRMIGDVDTKIDASFAQQGVQSDTMRLIADELINLGEALPRIGIELAALARELRDRVEAPPKKKILRRGWSVNQ